MNCSCSFPNNIYEILLAALAACGIFFYFTIIYLYYLLLFREIGILRKSYNVVSPLLEFKFLIIKSTLVHGHKVSTVLDKNLLSLNF